MDNEAFMRLALEEAEKAFNLDEVPVGAIISFQGKIIARAHNSTRGLKSPTRHAEIVAIEEAAAFLQNERLTGCCLYVTKEPCAMCAGAIVNARMEKVFIGAPDRMYGACGTVLNVCGNSLLNHVPEIEFGLLEEESSGILKKFFKDKRLEQEKKS